MFASAWEWVGEHGPEVILAFAIIGLASILGALFWHDVVRTRWIAHCIVDHREIQQAAAFCEALWNVERGI